MSNEFIIPEEIIILKKKKKARIIWKTNINYCEEDDNISEGLYDTGTGKHTTNDFLLC
jgi:hypothetical protein